MESLNVLVTRPVPETGLNLLRDKGYNIEIYPGDDSPDKDYLLKHAPKVKAMLSLLTENIDREIIDAAPHLKIIANMATGYNNIDVEYAHSKGIVVTNTPDVLTAATADLTWALILAVTKRIVEADRFLRNGKFKLWGPLLLLGSEVSGKTLGIIGAGRIGQAVGRRAAGFEMKILYKDESSRPDFEKQTGARRVELDALLSQADIVTLHCPLIPETHHLINRDNIRSMKKGAYLINAARGPIVEEAALIEALEERRLAGAGLDVYEFEPAASPKLIDRDDVVLLPHIGSATLETRSEMACMAARNIIAVLEGKPPLHPVTI